MAIFKEWKRKIYQKKWRPAGNEKRGRSKPTWIEGIKGLMGEKGLMEEDWIDRNNLRKKKHNCQIGAGKCEKNVQPAKL